MPIVFNFLHCSNAQSLFWHSRQFLDCDILWNQKNKLHLPSTHWHRIPFPIPKEKWGHSEEDWTMARLKPGRANTKSGSSVSDTWGFSFKGPWRHIFPAAFHTPLSLVTFTPYVQLCMADVSLLRYLNILSSERATQASSSQLYAMNCCMLCTGAPTLPNIDVCNRAELNPETKNPWPKFFYSFFQNQRKFGF